MGDDFGVLNGMEPMTGRLPGAPVSAGEKEPLLRLGKGSLLAVPVGGDIISDRDALVRLCAKDTSLNVQISDKSMQHILSRGIWRGQQ